MKFSDFSSYLHFLTEVPSPDEVEVYKVLQECLEMRKRYVFTEAIAPWVKEVILDPSTPKPNPEPFFYVPEGKSDVSLNYLFKISVAEPLNLFLIIFSYFNKFPFVL